MVLGWRKAFCTSIPKAQDPDSPIIKPDPSPSPRSFGRFFSNPSTPRPPLRCRTAPPNDVVTSKSAPQSPKLQCKTTKFFPHHRSTPSSPRSPSAFSLIKSTIGLSKSRCGICLQRVKTGEGTAIFTAECGHAFHFPCITAHVNNNHGSLKCPNCSLTWKEIHLFQDHHPKIIQRPQMRDANSKNDCRSVLNLKVYNDDEPLSSPTCGARFNPIPESDETEDENEAFPGFQVSIAAEMRRNLEVAVSPETAVVSVGKSGETYAVVLKIKAPSAAASTRAPVDLVTVLDVSRSVAAEKLQLMKRAMRVLVSSLSAADRLSIVAFSAASKRLLPLRRMNAAGKRSARRIIDAIVALDCAATSAADSIKKAAKVIDDRREKNPAASIVLFSDGHRNSPIVTSTSFSDLDIPVHSVSLSACLNAPPDDTFAKCITGLVRVVIQDLKIQLGFKSGSPPDEISAVYSYHKGKPAFLGSGSSWCRVGCLHSEEEIELLIELKVPSLISGAQRLLSVRCSYKDPSTQRPVPDEERALPIPRPRAVGSSTRETQRLKCLFVTTRAVAESRRLVERDDVAGAHYMLASARALVLQMGSGLGLSSGDEFVRGLEAELAELKWKRNAQLQPRLRESEEKAEPLMPTSAWRAAERLAKVAIIRKSLNRVSDLHGFENARF